VGQGPGARLFATVCASKKCTALATRLAGVASAAMLVMQCLRSNGHVSNCASGSLVSSCGVSGASLGSSAPLPRPFPGCGQSLHVNVMALASTASRSALLPTPLHSLL
jgi:hypothetical protein